MKRFKIIGLCLVAAFALSAAMASGASAHLYGTCLTGEPVNNPPCKGGEHFTPFSESGEMVVSHGTTPFLLLSETTPAKGIVCTTLEDMGIFKNDANDVGLSEDELVFKSCTPINLSGCTMINQGKGLEITGKILDEVSSTGKEALVTVEPNQFNVKCVIAGEEVELGFVTGSPKGKVNGDKLEFSKSGGLTFFGNNSTITGTNLTETLNKMPVFVH